MRSAPIVSTAMAIAIDDKGSVTELAAVLPRDGKGGDLIAYVYHSDSSRYSVALIDGGTHAARWQSQLLSKEAYQGLLSASQDMIYFTDKDQLFALHTRDGALAWQAALAGLRPNDTIVGFRGQPIASVDALHKHLVAAAIGVPSPMMFLRGTEKLFCTVAPRELPAFESRPRQRQTQP